MKTILILTALTAVSLMFMGNLYTDDSSEFEAYISTYQKSYTTESEYLFRKSIFESNQALINKINSEDHSYKLGMNKFGDWTDAEFSQLLGLRSSKEHVKPANWGQKLPSRNEKSIDWTAQGVVSPVKNQGSCGSCWAFSAVGALESAYAIRCDDASIQQFSEQQLVDCEEYDQGCNGGEMYNAFKFYTEHGACFEEHYAYTAKDGTCQQSTCETDTPKIASYKLIEHNDPDEIYDNLIWGPHSIGVEADKPAFRFFQSGEIDDDSCGHDLNHGVLLTGYIASRDAWKIKNSWGESWGENGYVYIKNNHQVSYGFCGVNMEISRPTL